MCGFMYLYDEGSEISNVKSSFDLITHRGPDSMDLYFSNGLWGFHRLSIIDTSNDGMQPFKLNNSIAVCNGEIYNYKELIDRHLKDHCFQSESDCEVLLPLFKRFGFDMFNMLDAEFALCIYDKENNNIVAARDPIGIRPLFYGYDCNNKICFASEMKVLVSIVEKVYPFPPGHYYSNDEFIMFYDASKVDNVINDSHEEVYNNIHDLLVDGVNKRLHADVKVGYLLSGGLDSSLVCSIAARNSNVPIDTFAVGMDTDPIDLKYAKIVSEHIGSNHTEVIITPKDVIDSLEDVIIQTETWDITTIRASIGMYLLCKHIKENTDIKVLQTGEVSDELFGYKYTDFAPSASEFQIESEKRIRELYMYDVLRADRCISGNSLEGRVPFADLKFVDYVLSLNPEIKLNKYNCGKFLLREAFNRDDYLPREILFRDKAAFSDAVGHSLVDVLKDYAQNYYTDEEFVLKKGNCPTKEALLYKEIFNKHYPNQEHVIIDYWMPNTSWEELKDVADPSARVLSNYGDSGK